jgi:protein tyrosine phosphatase (PTP) superfamily phosphohydrolase (DUF442 family)
MGNWMKAPTEAFRNYRQTFWTGISTPKKRERALHYQRWCDHGVLRLFWTNMHQLTTEFWRSNHPTPNRFDKLAAQGIRTIISLRGSTTAPWALLEQEACTRLGITLETVALQSRAAPQKQELLRLIHLFKNAQKPVLVHCKSGADRAGLASTIYLMVIEGLPVAEARKMLSMRYLHISWSKAGVLDCLLDEFASSHHSNFETWLSKDYDATKVQKKFARARG